MSDAIPTRPNGRPYRPRKSGLRARAWENDGHDDACGVIVFGTLDPEKARPLALDSAAHWYGKGVVTDPGPGWYRDAFERGERTWVIDEESGAPGVMFTWEESDNQATPVTEQHPSGGAR